MVALSLGGFQTPAFNPRSPPLVLGRTPRNSETYTEKVFKASRAGGRVQCPCPQA